MLLEFRYDCLQSVQLCVAVRSPVSSKHGEHHRASIEKIHRSHHLTLRVLGRELGKRLSRQ